MDMGTIRYGGGGVSLPSTGGEIFNYNQIKAKFGKSMAKELSKRQQAISAANPLKSDSSSNQPFAQLYQAAYENTQKKGLQDYARSIGNAELYGMLGGERDQTDPWGFYRESFANKLAQTEGTEDPSNIYKNKLAAMSTGQFGIDDPSYKFRFEQGQQALERSQASKGLLGSGNAAIELQQYGQGVASQEYGAQFNRMLQAMSGVEEQFNVQQNRLMTLAGVNLDPLGSRKVGVGEMGNAVAAQGNVLQAQSQREQRAMEQGQWQDQMGMNQSYQQGLKEAMAPAPSLVSQLGGGGESPSYWR